MTGWAIVDIIKSGSFKISALEVEQDILELQYIAEATVVGIEKEELGQRVTAAILLDKLPGRHQGLRDRFTIDSLRTYLHTKVPSYKLPTLLRVVDKKPTNKVIIFKLLFLSL